MSQHSGASNIKAHEKMKHLGMLDVIRHPDHYKAVIAVVGVMIAQQLTGMW
jgi:hypothetical protein